MRRRAVLVSLPLMVVVLLFSIMLLFYAKAIFGANVSYDHRSVIIDGKRRLLISGSIHYPRSTPYMWPDLIMKAKEGGLNTIDTYVFWNMHEPVKGQYDFEGRKDLVKFIKLVADSGLFLVLRIGPYVCAEWNYGGFPVWLHFVPGIEFRTDNEPFKEEMQQFTTKIVDMMKQENLFASQGGPIIFSQIENEYGKEDIEPQYGARGKAYVNWAVAMATSLNTGVPWIMCEQKDAPDTIVNTFNGFYCEHSTPNSDKKPKMWTENYTGWFLSFGGRLPYRPVEDIAFAVSRFFQLGGAFQNYYLYHGGTNFGRTSGGPFISTSYNYDAPLDEYGLPNQPKWGHLKDLHSAIKVCEEAMVATDPNTTSLGQSLEVSVYKTSSGLCAAFLANTDNQSDATVNFNGNSFKLPAWSVSILPDCKNVVFNSAKINSMTSIRRFATSSRSSFSDWKWLNEPVGISSNSAFSKNGLLEQINTTADKSDYLWYSVSVDIQGSESFLRDGSPTVLHIESLGHALHAFVNGKLAGSETGNVDNVNVTLEAPVSLNTGINTIDLLSLTVGLQEYGAFYDIKGAGITGPVQLKGSKNDSTIDLSSNQWTYQVGLAFKGEELGLNTGIWISGSTLPTKQPLIWYKAKFVAPAGNDPIAIDFTGMGKGEAWINGQSIGRYWPTNTAPNDGCTTTCDYRGSYYPEKCLKNCGKPSQLRYHVPRDWIKPRENTLVLFEENGGDPTLISFTTEGTRSLCGHILESHPAPIESLDFKSS